MENTINRYNIRCLWHFTDKSNLALIKKHGGLLSFSELYKRGIEIPEPGGNEWSHVADIRKGLDKYVHLTFCAESPMLWTAQNEDNRIPNPTWLKINRDLLLGENVRFCAGVANRSGAKLLNATEAEEEIDFEALFGRRTEMWDRWMEARKSEILIPDFIPLKYITIE